MVDPRSLIRQTIRRTIQFVLMLNRFEHDALGRIAAAGGYRSKSEALRYLIRREDPDAIALDLDLPAQVAKRAADRVLSEDLG